MNWEMIGAIGEVAGAIGVVATLIYLSVQLKQNTKATQIAAIQNSMENSARFSELLSTDGELAEVFWLGLSRPEALSAESRRKFVTTLNVFMRRESVAFYLHKEGAMPDHLWASRVSTLAGTLNQPGMKVFLAAAAETLPEDFRCFVEDVMRQETTMSAEAKSLLFQRDA